MRKEHESSLGAGAESPGCFLWAQPLAWGGSRGMQAGSPRAGKGDREGAGGLGYFSPYLLELLCPAESTACKEEKDMFHHSQEAERGRQSLQSF